MINSIKSFFSNIVGYFSSSSKAAESVGTAGTRVFSSQRTSEGESLQGRVSVKIVPEQVKLFIEIWKGLDASKQQEVVGKLTDEAQKSKFLRLCTNITDPPQRVKSSDSFFNRCVGWFFQRKLEHELAGFLREHNTIYDEVLSSRPQSEENREEPSEGGGTLELSQKNKKQEPDVSGEGTSSSSIKGKEGQATETSIVWPSDWPPPKINMVKTQVEGLKFDKNCVNVIKKNVQDYEKFDKNAIINILINDEKVRQSVMAEIDRIPLGERKEDLQKLKAALIQLEVVSKMGLSKVDGAGR